MKLEEFINSRISEKSIRLEAENLILDGVSDFAIYGLDAENITIVLTENCENVIIADCKLKAIKLSQTNNCVILRNKFADYLNLICAIEDRNSRNLAIIENNFEDKLKFPMNLERTKIVLINGNKFNVENNSAVKNDDCEQIFGDEIAGQNNIINGVDLSRLPQIDKEKFVNMNRKCEINGKNVYDFIIEAYKNGEKYVIIPPGAYFIPGENYKNQMEFNAVKDFKIYAYNVLFEFEHFNGPAFYCVDCVNFAIKGLTLDYAIVPTPQGKITGIADGDCLIWTADTGYIQDIFDETLIIPAAAEAYRADSDVPYCDTGWEQWEIRKISDGMYRVPQKNGLKIGSKVIFRGRFAHVNLLINCSGMIYEDVNLFGGSGFGFMEIGGNGGTKLNRVAITPGPKPIGATEERLISTCDATHAVNMREGLKVTNCFFEKMTDDATNNCGSYGLITNVLGNSLTYTKNRQGSCCADFLVGDRALIFNLDGKLLCDCAVIGVENNSEINSNLKTLTLEKSFDGFKENETIIENGSANGNNFLYDNCLVQNNRSRGFLIKSPYGTIKNCTLKDNGMSAILISPEIADNWGECGFSWNIKIVNNKFIGGGFFTGSELHSPINITGDSFPKDNPQYYNHKNILIENNSFEERYTKYCINVNSISGLKIIGNKFCEMNKNIENSQSSFALRNPIATQKLISEDNKQPPINIQGSENVEISGNKFCFINEAGDIVEEAEACARINIGECVNNLQGEDL